MKNVQIVIGSVRPNRIGEQVGEWIYEFGSEFEGLSFEIVDLKKWRLPLDDEPDQPARGRYVQQHTLDWSGKISAGDGYIFVTPQYNWGYPASLKNALDHLYKEWSGKPALIVSYGHRGGVKASEQLRQVLEGLHMKTAQRAPALVFQHEMLDELGRLKNINSDFAQYKEAVQAALGELAATLAS